MSVIAVARVSTTVVFACDSLVCFGCPSRQVIQERPKWSESDNWLVGVVGDCIWESILDELLTGVPLNIRGVAHALAAAAKEHDMKSGEHMGSRDIGSEFLAYDKAAGVVYDIAGDFGWMPVCTAVESSFAMGSGALPAMGAMWYAMRTNGGAPPTLAEAVARAGVEAACALAPGVCGAPIHSRIMP